MLEAACSVAEVSMSVFDATWSRFPGPALGAVKSQSDLSPRYGIEHSENPEWIVDECS